MVGLHGEATQKGVRENLGIVIDSHPLDRLQRVKDKRPSDFCNPVENNYSVVAKGGGFFLSITVCALLCDNYVGLPDRSLKPPEKDP